MKTTTLLLLLIFAIAKIHAQNYQISFAGTGASSIVDSVKVENLTQCTSLKLGGSDILHLISTIGINELNTVADNIVHVYPNPMRGNCLVDFEATAQSKTTIGLYDISGKRILQVQELLAKGHHTYSLHGISIGIYTLKIKSDKYSYTEKIVSSNETYDIAEIKHVGTTPGLDKYGAASNTGKMRGLKEIKSLIDMQYTIGDILKLTGKSGDYRTIFMLVPTQTQTVTFNFVACTDADNNNYSVVQIGTQTWMAENLGVTHYRNGEPIPNITGNSGWLGLTTGAYCWYNNDDVSYKIPYGALYNWYAVNDSRNLSPTGWHVPTDAEWTILTTFLGVTGIAGGKLKDVCSTYWYSPNTGATNESGFTALPGGYRTSGGAFESIGTNGDWWSSTEYSAGVAWYREMQYINASIIRSYFSKKSGFSVRCVKD